MKVLSQSELEIMNHGLSSPENLDVFCRYFYNRGGDNYFMFDRNFEPDGRWQTKLVFAKQTLIVGVMGIGSGKTLGVGMGAVTWCLSASDFKFMNGANWAYQSKLMKELVMAQLIDTPAYNFIENEVDTPYPKIEFGMKIGKQTFRSTMEFMSMDKQAAKIFSWRGDWINLDEAALVEDLDIALMNLSTRLTGRTAKGREFLGRMSLMTNPWDNENANHIYYFYDLALENPEECLSISVPTSANKNVTDRQINNAMRYITSKDEQDRLFGGMRPEGAGKFFAKDRVKWNADPYLSEYVRTRAEAGEKGFHMVGAPTLGAVEYRMPKSSDELILVGDPGTGSYPARNAPCLMVIDASKVPLSPAVITAFWWGSGGGTIQPFIDKLFEYKEMYSPMFVGVDSTGPQAGMVHVLNISQMWVDGLRKKRIADMIGITGMDFSVGRKMNMLVSLRNLLEMEMLKWADFAKGIKTQLYSYDPLLDRGGEPKIAQDIVATMAMGAFVVRAYYGLEMEGTEDGRPTAYHMVQEVARNMRLSREARERRGPTARSDLQEP